MRSLGRAGIARDRMVAARAELGIVLGQRHGRDAGQLHDPPDPGGRLLHGHVDGLYRHPAGARELGEQPATQSLCADRGADRHVHRARHGARRHLHDRADHRHRDSDGEAGRLRSGLVRYFSGAGGGNGGSLSARRLQPVRPADHERQGLQHGRQGGPAVLLFARSRGCHHHCLSCYRDGAAADGVPWLERGIVMLRLVKMFATAACVAALAVPAMAQTKWNLPAAYPADNPHSVNLIAFAKDVGDATGGKLQITVHPAASLFKAPEIKRAVATGQAQLGEVLISLHENEDPLFGIDVVPFLVTSYPAAKKLWLASKPVIEKRLASQGLLLLFAVPWGPQGIYAKKDLNTMDDMKGLKWRAYNVGTARIAELVGAQPVTIQAAELPQALATGVVNAFMTSGSTGYDSKAWETMTHFYDTQAWIPKNVTFVNKAAFDALDKPVQDAILKAAAVAEDRGWKLAEEKAKWYLEQLQV